MNIGSGVVINYIWRNITPIPNLSLEFRIFCLCDVFCSLCSIMITPTGRSHTAATIDHFSGLIPWFSS